MPSVTGAGRAAASRQEVRYFLGANKVSGANTVAEIDYHWLGGRCSKATALRGLLAAGGPRHPATGHPLSEPLCFGIAGGIGAGYSFCPSIPRYGAGSGVGIVGRHREYSCDGSWYKDAAARLGVKTRITETASAPKALA